MANVNDLFARPLLLASLCPPCKRRAGGVLSGLEKRSPEGFSQPRVNHTPPSCAPGAARQGFFFFPLFAQLSPAEPGLAPFPLLFSSFFEGNVLERLGATF